MCSMKYFLISLALLASVLPGKADTVALFFALDEDLRALKMHPEVRELGNPVTVGTRNIHRLGLGPHRIYAVKMASGSVETAMSAQALLSQFRCDWAFSIGLAGSLDDSLEMGRWYRVERVVSWQSGSVTPAGFQPGERAAWDLDWDAFPTERADDQAETRPDMHDPSFSWTNHHDLRWAATSGSGLAVRGAHGPPFPLIALASGEAFIASENERTRLRHLTEAEAVDMNSFGLAAVCADHRVPLFIWRIISDRADEEASEMFRNFVGSYDGRGGVMAAEWITNLPPNPDAPETYPEIRRLLPDERPPE